jgi:hypothetical protein
MQLQSGFEQQVLCLTNIQGVPGGKVNNLGGHSVGHSKQNLYMNMCLIPNGFRDRGSLLYSGLAWAPSIVLPSRPAAPLSEACESVEFSNINCTNSVT